MVVWVATAFLNQSRTKPTDKEQFIHFVINRRVGRKSRPGFHQGRFCGRFGDNFLYFVFRLMLKNKNKNRHEQQGQVVTTAIHCVNRSRRKYNNFISEWHDNTEPEAV